MTIAQVMQALLTLCAALLVASSSVTPCPNPCKCFTNDRGIQVANCTNLPDQMTTTWPQKNLRIYSGNDHASPIMLKNKAFKRFPRLTYLDITDVTIQYVGNAAFDGLSELLELNLVGTGIRTLHRNTFSGNRKLAFLSLKNNPRLLIGASFLASDSVTELDLSECALTSLKSVYFQSLPNLKYLFAANNDLKVLGSQFGPPGLKYVNLAHNRIESIREDLEAYKRLRTIDLTGNPLNCTCELSEMDRKLSARGVAFGNTVTCNDTGKPLGDMVEVCADKEMMGDEPVDMYRVDGLLKFDGKKTEEPDDFGSGLGSGSGDYEPATTTAENDGASSTAVVPSAPAGVGAVEGTADDGSPVEKTVGTDVGAATAGGVEPAAGRAPGAGNSTGPDGGIVSQTIQAPEDGDPGDDVQTTVTEYLKTNVGQTVTAVILALAIVAVVYKAVCAGKKWSRGDAEAGDRKAVELKEIKYMAADTEDSRGCGGDGDPPVEENRLLDGGDDDDDDDGDDDDRSGSSASYPSGAAVNGRARNGGDGLLNSVMDAVKSGGGDVPTRVVVKLGETPRPSKPVAVDNVR